MSQRERERERRNKRIVALCQQDKSLRTIAEEVGCSHVTVKRVLDAKGLKTVYGEFTPEYGHSMREEYLRYDSVGVFADTSAVTFRSLGGRHKRTIGFSFLTVTDGQNHRVKVFPKAENRITIKDIIKAFREMKVSKDETITADTKFLRALEREGFRVTSLDGWSAKTNLAEKIHGLKAKVYARIRKAKTLLGLTYKDLGDYPVLTLRATIEVFKTHGINIINLKAIEKYLKPMPIEDKLRVAKEKTHN